MGSRAMNESVEFLDVVYTTQHVRSRGASWTKKIFVHSWGPYPTMILPNVSTITRRAYNLPVTSYTFVLRANHERIILNHIESKLIRVEELLTRICQDIRDKVAANIRAPVNDALVDVLSDDSNFDLMTDGLCITTPIYKVLTLLTV